MRLHIHDFSGHPFQVQLSRSLASRGHEVLHAYSTQYVTGHGDLQVRPHDPATLRIEGVTADRDLVKYSPVGRTRFELAYARAVEDLLGREPFDVVVACNIPLFATARLRRRFAAADRPWVFWHQDVYSRGMAAEAAAKLPAPLAAPVGRAFERTERALVRDASAVVAIGAPFTRQYRAWDLDVDHVTVQPNWAPLDLLSPGPRDNPWAARHGLPEESVRLLYAGTLGRKHNPLLLLTLLDEARRLGVDAHLTVVSEGVGADDLAAAAAGRRDVTILGYQSAEDLPLVLASADVMLALLEPDAAEFSVPSKVLTYLAAGRPTIGLIPAANPAALDIVEAGGFAAGPDDAGARDAASWLAETARDGEALGLLGKKARALAEERFDIETITDVFERVLERAAARGVGRRRAVPAAGARR